MWLALALKPFAAVLLILLACFIANAIKPLSPDGPLKRKLYSPLPAYRESRRNRPSGGATE